MFIGEQIVETSHELLFLFVLPDIDNEGVVEPDHGEHQPMGDESIEVRSWTLSQLVMNLGKVLLCEPIGDEPYLSEIMN